VHVGAVVRLGPVPEDGAPPPYGVRHADMPLTPAQVWRAIQGRPFRTDLAIS
jgi:hypothetical protein